MSEYHSFQVSKAVPILEPQWPDLMRFIILLLSLQKPLFRVIDGSSSGNGGKEKQGVLEKVCERMMEEKEKGWVGITTA